MKTRKLILAALALTAVSCTQEKAAFAPAAELAAPATKAASIDSPSPSYAEAPAEAAAPMADSVAGDAERGLSAGGEFGGGGGDKGGDGRLAKERPAAGQLTAGEWSDVDHWEFWQNLMDQSYAQYVKDWGFELERRFAVKVEGAGQRNAQVQLLDKNGRAVWTAKTDRDGSAVLFAGAQDVGPFTLQVAGQTTAKAQIGEVTKVALQQAQPVADAVDVMFVVDVTGSMGDELSYIQSELTNVANRVKEHTHNELTLRMAASVYRDTTDAFVVRSTKFGTNIATAQNFIDNQMADGGGDFPEAVDEALDEAIHEHQWDPRARARVLFLVLDAPPHGDSEGKARLHKAVKTAAAQGIQLIPVAGSGINKETEFLMRSIALSTNGTYVFLTNDSGIGGGHIEPTTGKFDVEPLNDLLVRLVVEAAS